MKTKAIRSNNRNPASYKLFKSIRQILSSELEKVPGEDRAGFIPDPTARKAARRTAPGGGRTRGGRGRKLQEKQRCLRAPLVLTRSEVQGQRHRRPTIPRAPLALGFWCQETRNADEGHMWAFSSPDGARMGLGSWP